MIFLKKTLSVLLVIAMLFSVLGVSVSAATTETLTAEQKTEMKIKRADVNADGVYDTTDAKMLLKAAAGIYKPNNKYDVNLDGATSISDALLVLKQASGIAPVVSKAELVKLFNKKLNDIKNDTPGFKKTSTATCQSMKITQKVTATGFAAIAASSLSCTDLEYDQYVEKMTSMFESAGLSAEEQANIDAMKKSAEDYRKPQSKTYTAAKDDYYDHYKLFPREFKNTASEVTASEVSSVTFSAVDGTIVYTLRMPVKTYTESTFPSDPTTSSYGKIFNLVNVRETEGSTINSLEFKNGKVVMTTDAATGEVKKVVYYYDYSSNIQAPRQTQTESGLGTITIDVTTKTKANIKEIIDL